MTGLLDASIPSDEMHDVEHVLALEQLCVTRFGARLETVLFASRPGPLFTDQQ